MKWMQVLYNKIKRNNYNYTPKKVENGSWWIVPPFNNMELRPTLLLQFADALNTIWRGVEIFSWWNVCTVEWNTFQCIHKSQKLFLYGLKKHVHLKWLYITWRWLNFYLIFSKGYLVFFLSYHSTHLNWSVCHPYLAFRRYIFTGIIPFISGNKIFLAIFLFKCL